jgi:hypothetical protein
MEDHEKLMEKEEGFAKMNHVKSQFNCKRPLCLQTEGLLFSQYYLFCIKLHYSIF